MSSVSPVFGYWSRKVVVSSFFCVFALVSLQVSAKRRAYQPRPRHAPWLSPASPSLSGRATPLLPLPGILPRTPTPPVEQAPSGDESEEEESSSSDAETDEEERARRLQELVCAICLETAADSKEDDAWVELPGCGHNFHLSCARRCVDVGENGEAPWDIARAIRAGGGLPARFSPRTKNKRRCPICRHPITPDACLDIAEWTGTEMQRREKRMQRRKERKERQRKERREQRLLEKQKARGRSGATSASGAAGSSSAINPSTARSSTTSGGASSSRTTHLPSSRSTQSTFRSTPPQSDAYAPPLAETNYYHFDNFGVAHAHSVRGTSSSSTAGLRLTNDSGGQGHDGHPTLEPPETELTRSTGSLLSVSGRNLMERSGGTLSRSSGSLLSSSGGSSVSPKNGTGGGALLSAFKDAAGRIGVNTGDRPPGQPFRHYRRPEAWSAQGLRRWLAHTVFVGNGAPAGNPNRNAAAPTTTDPRAGMDLYDAAGLPQHTPRPRRGRRRAQTLGHVIDSASERCIISVCECIHTVLKNPQLLLLGFVVMAYFNSLFCPPSLERRWEAQCFQRVADDLASLVQQHSYYVSGDEDRDLHGGGRGAPVDSTTHGGHYKIRHSELLDADSRPMPDVLASAGAMPTLELQHARLARDGVVTESSAPADAAKTAYDLAYRIPKEDGGDGGRVQGFTSTSSVEELEDAFAAWTVNNVKTVVTHNRFGHSHTYFPALGVEEDLSTLPDRDAAAFAAWEAELNRIPYLSKIELYKLLHDVYNDVTEALHGQRAAFSGWGWDRGVERKMAEKSPLYHGDTHVVDGTAAADGTAGAASASQGHRLFLQVDLPQLASLWPARPPVVPGDGPQSSIPPSKAASTSDDLPDVARWSEEKIRSARRLNFLHPGPRFFDGKNKKKHIHDGLFLSGETLARVIYRLPRLKREILRRCPKNPHAGAWTNAVTPESAEHYAETLLKREERGTMHSELESIKKILARERNGA